MKYTAKEVQGVAGWLRSLGDHLEYEQYSEVADLIAAQHEVVEVAKTVVRIYSFTDGYLEKVGTMGDDLLKALERLNKTLTPFYANTEKATPCAECGGRELVQRDFGNHLGLIPCPSCTPEGE